MHMHVTQNRFQETSINEGASYYRVAPLLPSYHELFRPTEPAVIM